jgi:hypothetical protein
MFLNDHVSFFIYKWHTIPTKQRKLHVKDIQQEEHVDVAKEALEVPLPLR